MSLEGFSPASTTYVVEGLFSNPPYNVNKVEVEGMLAEPMETPKPSNVFGPKDSKSLLPMDGNDRGM